MNNLKQLVVFLCKDNEWESYKESNPGFSEEPISKDVNMLRHDDAANHRTFVVLKWVDTERNHMRGVMLKEETPGDLEMTNLPWVRRLKKIMGETNATLDVIVFIHWGGIEDPDKLRTASENLQKYLRTKGYATWKIYSLSSQNMDVDHSPIGRVFDVSGPVVPVSNFDKWLAMYEIWWNERKEGVDNEDTCDNFPNHKDGKISFTAKDSPPSKEEGSASTTQRREEQREQTGENDANMTKTQKVSRGAKAGAFVVGLMMMALSMAPAWLAYQCLEAVSYQAKTTRGTVVLLLMVLLAVGFSEIILGWLFLTLLPRRKTSD